MGKGETASGSAPVLVTGLDERPQAMVNARTPIDACDNAPVVIDETRLLFVVPGGDSVTCTLEDSPGWGQLPLDGVVLGLGSDRRRRVTWPSRSARAVMR